MNMARRAESTILKREAEYRVAGVPLRPQKGVITQVHPDADRGFVQTRLKYPTHVSTRLGERVHEDTRICHACKQMGHVVANCPTKAQGGQIVLHAGDKRSMGGNGGQRGGDNGTRSGGQREDMSSHRTPGVKCDHCGRMGHTKAQCWAANPHLRPFSLGPKIESKQRRHMAALRVTFAQEENTRRVVDSTGAEAHFSPGYEYRGGSGGFQGMALTYRLSPAVAAAVRDAVLPPAPARRGRGRPPSRRVGVASAVATAPPSSDRATAMPIVADAAMDDEELDPSHLPQTFHYGLPPSSFEP